MSSELQQLMAEFEPDAQALLLEMCRLVTPDDLQVIAECDYGDQAAEHLAGLRSIIETGDVAYPPEWCPHEVCGLTRWSGPDVFDPRHRNPTEDGVDAHRRRAFSAAYCLRFEYKNMGRIGTANSNESAAVMIASSLSISSLLVQHTRKMLAALVLPPDIDELEKPLLALGVLVCSLADAEAPVPPATLSAVARAIEDTDAELRAEGGVRADDFVLGLPWHDQRHDLWRSLVQHFLVEPQRPHPPEADAALRRLGRMILDGVKS
ncbi:MAG: hypothetical protein IBJ10_08180 [Phycisphaerales bacterium]|nr:hypothetical protein [Phycisphaerales bacterium]